MNRTLALFCLIASFGLTFTFAKPPASSDKLTALRALKIEHWEIPRMRKAMPEVLEQLQKTIEERSA